LWLVPAAANMSAFGQASDDGSNSSATRSSLADWTEFHRDNMKRWNPYETVLGINNVGGLQVKWKHSASMFQHTPVSSPAVGEWSGIFRF